MCEPSTPRLIQREGLLGQFGRDSRRSGHVCTMTNPRGFANPACQRQPFGTVGVSRVN
jgi:hypothetical protein